MSIYPPRRRCHQMLGRLLTLLTSIPINLAHTAPILADQLL
jgi:hypothetical protein